MNKQSEVPGATPNPFHRASIVTGVKYDLGQVSILFV